MMKLTKRSREIQDSFYESIETQLDQVRNSNIPENKQEQLKTEAKVWFFGDSFTYGCGCRPGYEYYDNYAEDIKLMWTDIISEKLKLKQVNLGINGNSNPYIIYQLLTNISNIKPGDVVFLTDTEPNRILLSNPVAKDIRPLSIGNIEEAYKEGIQDTEKKVTVEYLYQTFIGKEEIWENHYWQQLYSIKKILDDRGVKTHYWSYKLWKDSSKFETIKEATNGKVNNTHWSWKGHRDFSEYIINMLEV